MKNMRDLTENVINQLADEQYEDYRLANPREKPQEPPQKTIRLMVGETLTIESQDDSGASQSVTTYFGPLILVSRKAGRNE